MVAMHKIINSTFDNASWKYDSWNTSLLFNTKEHSSLKEKKKKDFASEGKHTGPNRHF